MKVRELMTPNPACAELETTVEEIATLMKSEDVGCIPVLDEDGEVAGVITDRDIVIRCIAEGKDPAECRAADIISPQSVNVSPNADSKEAARIMADRQIRRLAVVENGKLVGMLSLGDVAVKEHDDRLSGDVLHEVSEGVKSGSDASRMHAHQGGSRSGVKTSITGGSSKERSEELHDDARPSASFESGQATPQQTAEARRHEKVLPFRERVDRVHQGTLNRSSKDRKKIS